MTTKAAEKIIDALTQLMEGFSELQQSIEEDFGSKSSTDEDDDDQDEEGDVDPEVDAAIVTEVKAALEGVIEGEDISPEEIALLLSTLGDALEEIDPNVFETEAFQDDEEAAVYGAPAVDDDDYEDIDDDDIDLDDDEDEDDEEDEDEDEDEEDEEEDED